MKNKNTILIIVAALVVLAIVIISALLGGPEKPVVGEDGRISGNYSLESIMSLNEPYRCIFEITGEESIVSGTVFTNKEKAYGEFRISTTLVEDQFNSFLIMREGEAYIWTSLYPFGYKTKVADSAITNATPEEQAQIIGMKDKLQYECDPWENADDSTFDPPSWITFSELEG